MKLLHNGDAGPILKAIKVGQRTKREEKIQGHCSAMETLARAFINALGRPLRSEGNSGSLEGPQGRVALMMEQCDMTPNWGRGTS